MTIKIASTTDTESEITEAMTPKIAPSEMSEPQADGVPSEDVASEPTEESVEVAAPDTEVVDSKPESEPVAEEEEETGTPVQVTVSEDDLDETPKPKRRRRGRSYKERASQLAREKSLEKSRADTLEAELQSIRSTVHQSAAVPFPPVEQTQTETTSPAATDGRPKQEDFETYEEYQDSTVEWKVQQKINDYEADQRVRIEREQVQRAQGEIVATHTARIDTFRSAHEDFDAVIAEGASLPVTPPMRDAVLNSDAGPALMYHLCTNPDECDRIANMHPMAAIKEMGKLEAQIEAAIPTGPPSSAKHITQAPPPIKPVGGGATASTVPLDQLPYQEFKRIRDKQERDAREQGR
jgi:hypothetical protein|tara:strand:+ start:4468 stop:5523 length:1056 start_codon:yes stop_codon:yes gene_type:complete